MVPDESTDGDPSSDPPAGDPVQSAFDALARNPQRTVVLAVAVVLVLAYSVFIVQELLLVFWLLLVGFLIYLVWRFVRAHERIAGAAEQLADGGD